MCARSFSKQQNSSTDRLLLKQQLFPNTDQKIGNSRSTRKDINENLYPTSAKIYAQIWSDAHKQFSLKTEAACKPGLK